MGAGRGAGLHDDGAARLRLLELRDLHGLEEAHLRLLGHGDAVLEQVRVPAVVGHHAQPRVARECLLLEVALHQAEPRGPPALHRHRRGALEVQPYAPRTGEHPVAGHLGRAAGCAAQRGGAVSSEVWQCRRGLALAPAHDRSECILIALCRGAELAACMVEPTQAHARRE